MKVYAANEVFRNDWLYNTFGASGILGYGVGSPYLNRYITVEGQMQYSIALSPELIEGSSKDFISFGNLDAI